MTDTYVFDLYPRTNPLGARLVRFTTLQTAEWTGEANGSGQGRFSLRGTGTEADFVDPDGLQYVRVVRIDDTVVDGATLSGFDELVVGGFFTDSGESVIYSETGTRLLTWGGAGPLTYLQRGVQDADSWIDDPFIGTDPQPDGSWPYHLAGTGNELGAILWRILHELEEPGRHQNPVPAMTLGFTHLVDSNAAAWVRTTGDFVGQVADDVIDPILRLMKMGLYIEVDYDTLEVRAYEPDTHRRDRTGGAWGADVVRFQAPIAGDIATGNIKSNMTRALEAKVRRNAILTGSNDTWLWVLDPTVDVPWEGGKIIDDEAGTSLLKIGEVELAARGEAGDTARLRMKRGNDPLNGRYRPFEHIKPDDIVTVHTGTGANDYNEREFPVAAINMQLRPGGDWDCWVDLGSTFFSLEQRAFQAQPVGHHTHPPNPRRCDPDPAIVTSTAWKALEHASLAGGEINPEPADWKEVGFDDSGWSDAVATGLDYAAISHANYPDFLKRHEIFLRKEFWIAAGDLTGADVALDVYADDGAVVYVNGSIIATLGTQWNAGPVTLNTTLARSAFVEGLNCVTIYVWNQEAGTDGTAPNPGATLAGLRIGIPAADHDLGIHHNVKRCDDVMHAALVPIVDLGGHFDSLNVEGALQELGVAGGSSLTVEDEGTPLATAATSLDFVGAGVTATGAGAAKTITIPGGSGDITFDELGWYNVEDYGAVHDGATDDTTAIQDAIDAWDAAGRNGVIYFPTNADKSRPIYLIAGALQDTGTFNSQLEIPQGSGFSNLHFVGGPATLRSNWAGTISGNPAVISAGAQDSLTLNQVFIRFDDIRIEVPDNPKLTALQLTKAATVRWNKLSIAATVPSIVPTNTNAVGLDLPWGLNDQNSGGTDLYIDSFYTGIRPSEQMVADAIYASYCARAVEMRGAQGTPEFLAHSVSIQRLNVWNCVRGIVFTGDLRWLHVGLMDVEHDDPSPFGIVYDIDDASNYGRGFIRLHTTDYDTGEAADVPLINGGTGLSFHFPHGKRWRLADLVEVPELGADPSDAVSGTRRLYAKSDGWYDIDDAGVVTGPFGTGGGGGYPEGTSFPGSPSTDDKFYRTDRNLLYFYDGTRWLTTELYRESFGLGNTLLSIAANAAFGRFTPWHTTYDMWLDTLYSTTFPAATNDANSYWAMTFAKTDAANASTTIVSFNTSADTQANWTTRATAIGALLVPATYKHMRLDANKAGATGTPGNLTMAAALSYRLVG